MLHADLGNGKTILKEQLSFLLTQLGYRVFWDSDFDIHKASDLRALSRATGKIVLFLDETSERFEAIDGILQLNLPNLVAFVCARTTLYELGEAKYDEYLPENYIPINLNRLSAQNARKFVTLFNRLGLWGERARLTDQEKLNFISADCGGAISRLIVSIFEDLEVGKRIRHAANSLLNDRSAVATVVIGSFLVSRIGQTPNPDILGDMMNQDVWNLMKSDPFKQAAEFIRFQSGGVIIRSSIISQYLLRNAIKPENLIWHIERFVRRLAVIQRSHTLHRIFTELQRFPLLESIISSTKQSDRKRRKEIVIGYYQSIKDLPYCQKNALFWLHYAMARLEFNEFDVATIYFEQAREFARGKEGETRDVNNHFARLLLDSRIRGEGYDDYFKAFQAAHAILVEQMNKNTNRHYPYRQAKKYVEYIAHRKVQFSPAELETFKSACRQVKSAIKNIRGSLAGAAEVKQCDAYMDRAIEIATLET